MATWAYDKNKCKIDMKFIHSPFWSHKRWLWNFSSMLPGNVMESDPFSNLLVMSSKTHFSSFKAVAQSFFRLGACISAFIPIATKNSKLKTPAGVSCWKERLRMPNEVADTHYFFGFKMRSWELCNILSFSQNEYYDLTIFFCRNFIREAYG